MPQFKFVRTVVHTEVVEVEADYFDDALERVSEVPQGAHQGDDSLVSIELLAD